MRIIVKQYYYSNKKIYNIKANIYCKSLENFTLIQAIFNIFNNNNKFFVWHIFNYNNRLFYLFFSWQLQHKFIKKYYNILFINTIYKINRYFMPLVIINNFISINISFYFAFAFLCNKKIKNYIQVMEYFSKLYI